MSAHEPATTAAAPRWESVIRPRPGLSCVDFGELWQYRELFVAMAKRMILIRYKQTLIGLLWAVIRPVLTMVVFTLLFGKLGQFPSGDIPYALLTFAAILPWQLFSGSLVESTNSLIANQNMIAKIYFPRAIMPTSACLAALVDFAISAVIFIGMMAWFGVAPTWRVLLLPALLLLAVMASLGAGLWLSALNVRFRDVRHVVPFVVQLGQLISPVGYSSSVIPEKWQLLYALNPMVSVIEGFRWALFSGLPGAGEAEVAGVNPTAFVLSTTIVLVVFLTGLFFFRHMERTFADYI